MEVEELNKLIMEPESGNSFTALLELPPNRAVELLTDNTLKNRLDTAPRLGEELMKHAHVSACSDTLESYVVPAFPSNNALVARAARHSVFASEDSESCPNVKAEPIDSMSDRVGSDPTGWSESEKPILKRNERKKKGKTTSKKGKTTPVVEDGEKLQYVHVRARRGQATDSHSLAERARREKINARMKLLQELVPGCNKISGTSLVLDEIINHVQYLQRQVEYLSMRLATVNPRVDFNLESAISAEVQTESMMDCNFPNMAMPLMWPQVQMNVERQQFQQQWHFEPLSQPIWVKEENHHNFVASGNSHLSYDSPANSASLHSSQLKMEL